MDELKQMLLELVETPHWETLKQELRERARILKVEALTPAESPMDFYTKEAKAMAALELENFPHRIELKAESLRARQYREGVTQNSLW